MNFCSACKNFSYTSAKDMPIKKCFFIHCNKINYHKHDLCKKCVIEYDNKIINNSIYNNCQ